MASFWSLKLLLKCIDFLSWPVLALGYPLFQYWHYMKLVIVVCLMMPDFGRAAYVYNHLIRSCLYMNPQAVMSRFRNWKRIFVEKEEFLMQAETYIAQHGTGALEKLIASKSTEQSPNAETKKAVPATEKNEILKTNRGRLHMEQKGIKDLEMIEKEEVSEVKQFSTLQANTALGRLKSNESASSSSEKTQKMVADRGGGAYPQISSFENVQKEWACAMCQLTMPSEAHLNSHLQGWEHMHKAACEALKAKKTEGKAAATDTGNGASDNTPLLTTVKSRRRRRRKNGKGAENMGLLD